MLLAPFTISDHAMQSSGPRRRGSPKAMPWLLAWSVSGAFLLLLVPGLWSNGLSGLSAPFWLVAAPLLDMLWLNRRRAIAGLRRLVRRSGWRPTPR